MLVENVSRFLLGGGEKEGWGGGGGARVEQTSFSDRYMSYLVPGTEKFVFLGTAAKLYFPSFSVTLFNMLRGMYSACPDEIMHRAIYCPIYLSKLYTRFFGKA